MAGVFDRLFGLPAEFFGCLGDVGVAGCNIAWPTSNNLVGYLFAAGIFEGMNELEHRSTMTGAEVVYTDSDRKSVV